MEAVGLICLLGLCSFDDIKSKQVRTIEICIFGIIGVLLHLINHTHTLMSTIGGMLIGAGFYLICIITKEKIGKGDALIIMVIGIYLGMLNTIKLIWISSVMAGFAGVYLLATKKQHLNYEMPFVPFMMVGYLMMYAADSYARIVA